MRIIPARAGFTPRSSATPTPKEDHPRSRGVYTARASSSWLGRGSSPLARGLPRSRRGGGGCPRIIPARAGFTAKPPTASWPPSDHPRSRGVYPITIKATIPSEGSSPLARGLLHGYHPVRHRSADHPRSRGVYNTLISDLLMRVGSSPLARGLLVPIEDLGLTQGIIPARAGFTPVDDDRYRGLKDHPRSRGVYFFAATRFRRRLWIIPARAGFTVGPRHHRREVPDHPRSRGVYAGEDHPPPRW